MTTAQIAGVRALYEMHLHRLSQIRSGASQHVYEDEQVVAFERETARLKAVLDHGGPALPL